MHFYKSIVDIAKQNNIIEHFAKYFCQSSRYEVKVCIKEDHTLVVLESKLNCYVELIVIIRKLK